MKLIDGKAIAAEMLEASGGIGIACFGIDCLEAANSRLSNAGAEELVLACTLSDSTPTGLAGYIDHGRIDPVDTLVVVECFILNGDDSIFEIFRHLIKANPNSVFITVQALIFNPVAHIILNVNY